MPQTAPIDSMRIDSGAIVYDSLGKHIGLARNIELAKATILLAPNGGGKTTVLTMLNPVIAAPGLETVEQLEAAYLLYSSLRPLPAAAGFVSTSIGSQKLYAAWASMASDNALHRLINEIEVNEPVKAMLRDMASVVRGFVLRSAEDAVETLSTIIRQKDSKAWQRGEFRVLADWSSKPRRQRRQIYLAALWAADGDDVTLQALAVHDTHGWAAALVRGRSSNSMGPLAYYHPLLVVENRSMLYMFRRLWATMSPFERKRFLELCGSIVNACTGVDTGFRDSGIVTVAVEATSGQGHVLLPLPMLGDGQRAALALMLAASMEKGTLIADTPESFTHPDLLDTVSEVLANASSRVRVVVATQSLELIDRILGYAATQGILEELLVQRLVRSHKPGLTEIKAHPLTGKEAYEAVIEIGVDIRKMDLLEA